ncbi:MAG: rhodanese-like domain-containing protein [Sulfurisoma sp.]|nr:rhodanese-like domain-containing protein [Sulfurisoma sp.]
MMLRALLVLPALLLAPPAVADKPLAPASVPGTQLVSAERVVELIGALPDIVIIDSRRREEFEKGHIEGAVSLLDTELTRAGLARLAPAPDRPLLFYCNGEHCLRSSNSAVQALAWGYRRVYWFRGGWQEWTDKHLPVAR